MTKRSLVDQLNHAVDALLAGKQHGIPPANKELIELARIAAELRDLPREEFKTELKDKILRRISMMTQNADLETKPRTIPEGWEGATPYICIKNAAKAIEFYKKAFGAKETMRLLEPSGRVGHAEIKIGNAFIMIADEYPEYGITSAETMGGSPISIHLYVENVDDFVSKAVEAGATLERPVRDEFYGDRTGRLRDPFGYSWNIATHIEDVTAEEMQNRFDTFLKEMPQTEPEQPAAKPVNFIPEGYHTITPYLMVRGADQLIDFVKQAFGAVELYRTTGTAGGLHAEVQIGTSRIMIGGNADLKEEATAAIYVYVPDVDAVYERALRAGAKMVQEPKDQPYGDRNAWVKDPFGNTWFIATHVKDMPTEGS
jgi:PhnB protein